jgi:triacylglycerol lipase
MRKLAIISLVLTTVATVSNSARAAEGVILLHGLCRTPASMARMERALQAEGFVVANVGYPSRRAGIEALSEAAIGGALERPELSGCSTVHFVTHSLGGILVRSYFSRHAAGRLGRVVMLGPPNQGSEIVDRLGHWWIFGKLNGPAGLELGTAADSTPNKLGALAFDCGVIAGDRSINWINSTMIAGRDDGKVSVERTRVAGMRDHLTLHAAHPFLAGTPSAIAATLRFLRNGAF